MGRRFRSAGMLTSGGRLTLLVLLAGLVVLAQAWLAAHRYGQHAAVRPEAPVPSALRQMPAAPPAARLPATPPLSTTHEPAPATTR